MYEDRTKNWLRNSRRVSHIWPFPCHIIYGHVDCGDNSILV